MTTSPISAQNAFEQHSEILQSCLAALESKQATVETYTGKFADFPELEELLYASTYLKQLPPVSLSGQSRTAIQSRVMASYRQRRVIKGSLSVVRPRSRWMMLMRPLVALLIVAIMLYTGGNSLLYAASQSIPGESLYGVKRTAEQVQLSFTEGQSRISLLDWLANVRLDEVASLVQRGIALTEPILNDVSSFVQQALKVQTDLTKRAALMQRTVQTLSTARQAGMLTALVETRILAQIDPALAGQQPAQNDTNTNDNDSGSGTIMTATSTPTPAVKPTKTRKPKPTKVKPNNGKGNGNSNPPKGGK